MNPQDFSNRNPRKWPTGTDAGYEDVLQETIRLYENLDHDRHNFRSPASEDYIELAIVSSIRDQNTDTAKWILSKLSFEDALLGYAMVGFHCIKRKIECSDLIKICDNRIGENSPKDARVLTFMALNKYLLGNSDDYKSYKSRAYARIDDYDRNEHRWAYINMLIFTDQEKTVEKFITDWKADLSTTFYVYRVWYNIIQYRDIDTLFWFNGLISTLADEDYINHQYFRDKIIHSQLESDLPSIVDQFGINGTRMVFPVLHHLHKNERLKDDQIEYWLDKDHIASIDLLLLLYAKRNPEGCRRFIKSNLKKIIDHQAHSFSQDYTFNYGKISSLINLRIDEEVAPYRLEFASYYAGLSYYGKSKSTDYLEHAFKLYSERDKPPINEVGYLLEASYKINYKLHSAAVNMAIEHSNLKGDSAYIYLADIVENLSKVGDFDHAYKIFKKTSLSKRSTAAENIAFHFCDERHFRGLIDLMKYIPQEHYNDIKLIFRAIITLNNFRGYLIRIYTDKNYKLL